MKNSINEIISTSAVDEKPVVHTSGGVTEDKQ